MIRENMAYGGNVMARILKLEAKKSIPSRAKK